MSLSKERLDEIRAKLRDEQDFDWDYPFDVAAEDLLTEVDRLAAEVERLRAEARSLQRSSQRNADAHMVTHRDNARLRAGIESLLNDPATHETYEGGAHACVDAEDLSLLLNPPTEGGTDVDG